jgi:nucleoside-diphosphate kinase
MMDRTLILFKPDAYRRGLVGEILARFERRGLRILGLKVMRADRRLLEAHYAEHRDSPYFPMLLAMMTRGPLVACVLAGDPTIIELTRRLLGEFRSPVPGTIRGDYQTTPVHNLVHASSAVPAALHEIRLWFRSEELLPDDEVTDQARP